MNWPLSLRLFSGLFSYTEIHYRFPWFPFSRYYRREPEIIVDVPYRVGPGKAIPVFLLIKDAHRFPLTLSSIQVKIKCPSGKTIKLEKHYDRFCDTHWFWDHLEYEPVETGRHIITGTVICKSGQRDIVINNHNVRTSDHPPLECQVDDSPLPGSDIFRWGDLHYHSSYTEDVVEFGAPLEMTAHAAAAAGLDFLAVTDHSYDLDDKPDSWWDTDPDLEKWQASRNEIKALNRSGPFLFLPGEEVTARNARGENIHFLIYDYPDFIPGSGDGAEKWFRTHSEYSIADIIKMTGDGPLKIAAHPFVPVSWLEKFLIDRGAWDEVDIDHDGLHGFQILNGAIDASFRRGLDIWRQRLLDGKKYFIYAGNDAHGNFNRFHQIRIPMLSTWWHRDQILAQCRNGIPRNAGSVTEIINYLKKGQSIITNGPAVYLTVNDQYQTGDSLQVETAKIKVQAASSDFFGKIDNITLYRGDLERNIEEIIEERHHGDSCELTLETELDITASIYIRAEVRTLTGRAGFTNPIWLTGV